MLCFSQSNGYALLSQLGFTELKTIFNLVNLSMQPTYTLAKHNGSKYENISLVKAAGNVFLQYCNMTKNLGLWKLILPGAETLSHDGMK